MYTDGSKDKYSVACVAVHGDGIASERLPLNASIFTAEGRGFLLVFKLITYYLTVHFCPDSLSCVLAIKSHKLQDTLMLQILYFIHRLMEFDK